VTEHDPLVSVHVEGLKVPEEDGESLKVTVPVGMKVVPGLESVIVAAQVVGAPTGSGNGEQMREVVLLRIVAVMVVVPLLAE
jgi:hypothetical protein